MLIRKERNVVLWSSKDEEKNLSLFVFLSRVSLERYCQKCVVKIRTFGKKIKEGEIQTFCTL